MSPMLWFQFFLFGLFCACVGYLFSTHLNSYIIAHYRAALGAAWLERQRPGTWIGDVHHWVMRGLGRDGIRKLEMETRTPKEYWDQERKTADEEDYE